MRSSLDVIRRSRMTPLLSIIVTTCFLASSCGLDREGPATEANVAALADPQLHGFMIVSDSDPGLAINAFGGAVNNGPLKLYRGCTWGNAACTWMYQDGRLLSDHDPSLGIKLAGSPGENVLLKLSSTCGNASTAPPSCRWFYREGHFISEEDPDYAIGVSSGPEHGSDLRIRDACTSSMSPRCTFNIQRAMISPKNAPGLTVTAAAAEDATWLKFKNNCSRFEPLCTFTFVRGMIVSDKDPTFYMMASGGPHHGAPVRLFRGQCNEYDFNPDCQWEWRKGALYNEYAQGLTLQGSGLADEATLRLIQGGCPASNATCNMASNTAGLQCGRYWQASCDGVTCQKGVLVDGTCMPNEDRTILCTATDNGVDATLQMGISRSGNWSLKGHVHNTGVLPWNYTVGLTFNSPVSGAQFGMTERGFVNGTFDIGTRDSDFDRRGKDGRLGTSWETFRSSGVQCKIRATVNPWLTLEAALIALGIVAVAAVMIFVAGNPDTKWTWTNEGWRGELDNE